MTVTATAPSPAPPEPRLDESNRSTFKDTAFRLLLLFCLSVGLVFLVLLLVSIFWSGLPRLSWDFITNMPSRRPERAGAQSAIMGSIWVTGFTALFCIPTGVARLHLPRGVRQQGPLVQPAHRAEPAEPGRRAGDRLRHPRPRHHRPRPWLRLHRPHGFAHPVPAGPPDGHRRDSGGDSRRSEVDSARVARPRRDPMADGVATGAARLCPRNGHRHRSWRCPGPSGRRRRCSFSAAVSFITFNPNGLDSRYTTLPIQIYNWTLRPQEEFRAGRIGRDRRAPGHSACHELSRDLPAQQVPDSGGDATMTTTPIAHADDRAARN